MGKSLSFIDPGLSAVTSGDPSNADPFDLLGTKASRSAQEAQKKQNAQERALKREFATEARQDVFNLFPAADEERRLGFQGALDVLGQSAPQQSQVLQSSSAGAQETLLAGLPQMRNAILGRNVSFSGLSPRTFDVDTSFMQQQLPEQSSITDALAGGGPQLRQGLTEEDVLKLTELGFLRGL